MRAAAAVLALSLAFAACSDDGDEDASETAAVEADGAIEGVEVVRFEEAGNLHREGEIAYDHLPPAGGLHNPVPARCGFYREPIPDEHVVHSLEHGAVWLAYSPDLPEADLDALHEIARANDETIVTPYEDLPDRVAVVASAWPRQLTLTAVDDPRLDRFVEQLQDGDQSPEASVACSGVGAGQPIP
ncbi:MAG: DUF3105 domain-containing protein [Acidimicrobiales bacterium]|nr:DUF3105 domain-containing protein [Acidimicrobiales bacterium]